MIHITVEAPDERRVFAFARERVVVGSDASADLVIDKPGVAARHIQIDHVGDELRVRDLRSRGVERVDIVEPGDVIRVGGVDLVLALHRLEPEHTGDSTERDLLDAIRARPDDREIREVYADWLEEHGYRARAEFLRAQLAAHAARSPQEPAFVQATAMLQQLAPEVGEGWRASVASVFIEHCPNNVATLPRWRRPPPELAMQLVCPMRWDMLAPTEHEGVRACSACHQTVTYCTTVPQARALAEAGRCVALDIAAARAAHDLEPPPMIGRPAPPLARYGRPR